MLLLASTLTVMAGAVLSPVLPLIRTDLHVTGTAAGLVLTAHGLAIAVTSPAIGWLLDRYGPRAPLAVGLVLYGLAGGAGLLLDSYPALIVSRLVFGVGAAAVFGGTTVALLALYQGAQQERVMGWRSTATSLGGVVWPLLGGALGGVSWHAPFGVYVLGLPLGIAAAAVVPAAYSSRSSGRAADSARRRAGGHVEGVLWLLRRRPAVLGLYALLGIGTALLYGLLVFLPLRLAETGIDSSLSVAALTVAMSIAMSLAGLLYARVQARLGYARLLRAAYLSFTLAFAALAVTDTLAVVVAAQVLFGFGMGVAIPALTVLLRRCAPPRLHGQVMALSGSAIFCGQFLSPLLLGPLGDATSVSGAFLGAAALAGLVLLALLSADLAPAGSSDGPLSARNDCADEHSEVCALRG